MSVRAYPLMRRVLLVQGDADDAVVIRLLLESVHGADWQVDWVHTAALGVEALARGGHDVCLLDVSLGLDVVRRARLRGCRVPVVVLGRVRDRNGEAEALEAGAADVLVKGEVDAASLDRALRYAVARGLDASALHERTQALETTRDELAAARTALAAAERQIAAMASGGAPFDEKKRRG